jgi:hypothetical protein
VLGTHIPFQEAEKMAVSKTGKTAPSKTEKATAVSASSKGKDAYLEDYITRSVSVCCIVVASAYVHFSKSKQPPCKESFPFQSTLNNTSFYCLNSKVHPGNVVVKG